MNKQQLRQEIIETLKQELDGAIKAAQVALDGATHEQSKAETQYDTLGLEHAYLAEGQSRRIDSLNKDIMQLESWSIPSFNQDDEIYLGALLALQDIKNKKTMRVFLVPCGGGITLKHDELEINVISPQTPLGEALLGLMLDEEVMLGNVPRFQICDLQ